MHIAHAPAVAYEIGSGSAACANLWMPTLPSILAWEQQWTCAQRGLPPGSSCIHRRMSPALGYPHDAESWVTDRACARPLACQTWCVRVWVISKEPIVRKRPMPRCRAQQSAAQLQLQDKLLLLRCEKHVEEAMAAAEQAAADKVRNSGEVFSCPAA